MQIQAFVTFSRTSIFGSIDYNNRSETCAFRSSEFFVQIVTVQFVKLWEQKFHGKVLVDTEGNIQFT